ncbi:hypothetical protein GCM10010329_33980 [Streptomyces spiroverticillatus]|uniref:Uncharacterized protein n=1 Tax=Streptomyces finlayi TaxID=67296 RepID=A0A918WWV4_9ACTN|nr:hypothetical protein GCM10010329_33980 [Streptomyces spiroverticillatus]GHC91405.1 hypothetical protein GCM10010334_26390 [Streptomyces finlayi]
MELHARFRGGQSYRAAGRPVAEHGEWFGPGGEALVQHPVVVEALRGDDLGVGGPDVPKGSWVGFMVRSLEGR